MSIRILQHTLGIQGYQLDRSEFKEGLYIAHISKKPNKQECVDCKSFNVTATFINERIIKVLPMGMKATRFSIRMHRLACHDCPAYRMEGIQFTSASTSRVSKYLEKKYLNKKHKVIRLKDVEAIGIDEVYMGKKFGRKYDEKNDDKDKMNGYLTIVRDLRSGAVIFVGKGKKGSCLDKFAVKVKRSKAIIKYIAVDLAASFTSWIQSNFSDATIVYDHFHVIKLVNDRLSKIRRRIMNELETEEKSELPREKQKAIGLMLEMALNSQAS